MIPKTTHECKRPTYRRSNGVSVDARRAPIHPQHTCKRPTSRPSKQVLTSREVLVTDFGLLPTHACGRECQRVDPRKDIFTRRPKRRRASEACFYNARANDSKVSRIQAPNESKLERCLYYKQGFMASVHPQIANQCSLMRYSLHE